MYAPQKIVIGVWNKFRPAKRRRLGKLSSHNNSANQTLQWSAVYRRIPHAPSRAVCAALRIPYWGQVATALCPYWCHHTAFIDRYSQNLITNYPVYRNEWN